MIIKSIRIVLLSCILIFSSCRKKVELPNPFSELKIGMTKKNALTKMESLLNRNILDDFNFVMIDSIRCKIQLKFCASCTGEKLEGIIIRSKNSSELHESFKQEEYAKEDLNVEILPILNSIFGHQRIDTMVGIYSDKLYYSDVYWTLACKRMREDPCWEFRKWIQNVAKKQK